MALEVDLEVEQSAIAEEVELDLKESPGKMMNHTIYIVGNIGAILAANSSPSG
jgi:hypothetical protein